MVVLDRIFQFCFVYDFFCNLVEYERYIFVKYVKEKYDFFYYQYMYLKLEKGEF